MTWALENHIKSTVAVFYKRRQGQVTAQGGLLNIPGSLSRSTAQEKKGVNFLPKYD